MFIKIDFLKLFYEGYLFNFLIDSYKVSKNIYDICSKWCINGFRIFTIFFVMICIGVKIRL